MDTIIDHYLSVMLGNIEAKLFSMKVKDVLPIYYVAVRGRDNVEGAVQRVLNPRRIASIKDFVLDGNTFYNLFILNWIDTNYTVSSEGDKLIIPVISNAAQVIDGQHRLEGLRQAYEIDSEIGERSILILLAEGLSTKEAAQIFLNINTEQKPVPNSLVFDLFGEIKDKDFYLVRAKDIAEKLNSDPSSPYYQCIKMPGSKNGKVDLSTMVNALKQYTKENAVFDQYHLTDFESQYKIIQNFFNTIKFYYDLEGKWLKAANPFLTNAGCFAGIEFLCTDLFPRCAEKKEFSVSIMKSFLPLNSNGLLEKEDIKNKQGKEQRASVYDYLKKALLKDMPSQNEYKF